MNRIIRLAAGRRSMRAAVLLLVALVVGLGLFAAAPANADVEPASLTIVNETNPDGGVGFPYTLASNGTSLVWGSGPAAAGNLSQPSGVARDAAGNLYVADWGNYRVQKFGPDGAFLLQWGSRGSGPGQFDRPADIAIHPTSGYLYVTDDSNSRVQVFDGNGTFVRQWGSRGTADGQFQGAYGIAIDDAGRVYVADGGNDRIQRFDADGVFIDKWGSSGSGAGQFSTPKDVAVDAAGNIYVTEAWANNRVQKFDSGLNSVARWGGWGSGNGQFQYPADIAFDSAGNVYVADFQNDRIQVFSNTGTFLRKWGTSGRGTGQLSRPSGIAIDPVTDTVYVVEQGNNRIQLFSNTGTYLAQWASLSDPGDFYYARSAGTDVAGNVYVADDTFWVKKYDSHGAFLMQFGGPGTANGQLQQPRGIAVAADGSIFVADSGNHRIQKFDSSGAWLTTWGGSGSTAGLFSSPMDVALDSAGTVYVTDYGNHRIQVFSNNGVYIRQWGTNGTADGQMKLPRGITIDADDAVYVTDHLNYRVQKFSTTGAFLAKWGSNGSGNGQFNSPSEIAVNGAGHVFVIDDQLHRVQKFSRNGEFLGKWGSQGAGANQFQAPLGIAADAIGNIFVADTNNHRIQKFLDGVTTLDDDETAEYTLDAATYKLGMNAPVGWQLSGISCDGGSPVISGSNVTITLAAGSDVTCTFTSGAQPELTLAKETDPDGGEDFPFTVSSVGPSLIWGGEGTADGQFNQLGGAAFDGDGNLYVVDRDAHRIQKFDKHGRFLFKWGSPGNGQGQFQYINYVAVDGSGNVYVTDHFANRVQKFDGDGNFLLAWGWDVVSGGGTGFEICTPADTCKAGAGGSGDGQFNQPTGIGVYDDGVTVTVYVSARFNQRIQKFDGNGNYLGQWGSAGSGNSQFNEGYGIAVDAAGNVYVADRLNHRIQKFNSDGVFLTKWGSNGGGQGQFSGPRGVAVDNLGHVYVADTDNRRFQKYSDTGTFLMAWGWDVVVGGGAGFEVCRPTDTCRVAIWGNGAGQFTDPWGVAVDGQGVVVVTDNSNDRVQKFIDAAAVLDDDGTQAYTLDAATYRIDETPLAGWTLTDITCDGGSPAESGDGVTVALLPSDDVTCAFTNTQAGSITVVKQVLGPAPAGNWTFSGGLGAFTLPAAGGTRPPAALVPGDYTITETPVTGYDQTVSCDSGESGTGSVTVSLQSGEAVTCTFVNDSRSMLTLSKETDPDGGADFPFTVSSVGPSRVWGSQGSGNGQFSEPKVEVSDGDGDFYVADTFNYRIQKFDKYGNFLLKWGSSGSSKGQFQRPYYLDMDGSGNIYVTDNGNHRVQKFDGNGNFLLAWGWDVVSGGVTTFEICGPADTCKAGASGSGSGQFNQPSGIGVSDDGASVTVYVTELNNQRVQMFDGDGNYLGQWGSAGSGNGQFSAPIGVAVDNQGQVYVADTSNNRIQKFDSDGVFLIKWGISGNDAGQFNHPYDVAVDNLGHVYVADSENHRIQKFSDTSAFLMAWGWDVVAGGGTGFEVCRPTDTCKAGTYGSGAGQFYYPFGVAADGQGVVVVGDAGNGRIQKFIDAAPVLDDDGTQVYPLDAATYRIDESVPAGWTLSDVACEGGSPVESGNGVTVALLPSNDVTCTFTNALPGSITVVKQVIGPAPADDWAFSSDLGAFTLPAAGGSSEPFADLAPGDYTITETAVAGYDQAVTCDSGETGTGSVTVSLQPGENVTCTFVNTPQAGTLTLIKETNPDGGTDAQFSLQRLLGQWGEFGSGEGQLFGPWAIAVDSAGNVTVADRLNHRVQVFDGAGNFLRQWGVRGGGNGQFQSPKGIAVDAAGNVYVADTNNHRIQKFTATGGFVTTWGSQGSGDNQFNTPQGIAVDAAGNVYVADTGNHRIQVFDDDGVFIRKWGVYGYSSETPGVFNDPVALAVNAAGVYVADRDNQRIQQFTPEGVFVRQWGASFSKPLTITLDDDGRVFVADEGQRFYTFTADGRPLAATRLGHLVAGGLVWPNGLAADGDDVLIMDTSASHIVRLAILDFPLLDDDESAEFSLPPGVYGAGELQDRWALSDLTCDGGSPVELDASVGLTLAAGEDVICTFTNTPQPGTIYLTKFVVGPDTAGEWAFTGDLGDFTIYSEDGVVFDDLLYGDYTISETAVPGYSATSSCDSGETGTGELTIALDPGETVRCTIINTYIPPEPATLTLIKETDPEGGTGFPFTVLGRLTEWGSDGSDSGQFGAVGDMAVDAEGNVFVVDPDNNRIQKFTDYGSYLLEWGSYGFDPGQFSNPGAIGIDGSGDVYVVDNDRIQRFDGSGTWITEWHVPNPEGLAIDATGKVYVIQGWPNEVIAVYQSDGTLITSWPTAWDDPHGIGVDDAGNVYVSEGYWEQDWNIVKYDGEGNELARWGRRFLYYGYDLVVDGDGNNFVGDYDYALDEYVTRVFDSTGTFLGTLRVTGTRTRDTFGNLYTAGENEVQKYAFWIDLLDDADTAMITLPPADYYVAENLSQAWLLDNIACDGGDPQVSGSSVSLTLAPDAAVTCVFSNEGAPGHITVVKKVVGPPAASDWQFSGDLETFSIPASGGTADFPDLDAGDYTITETAVAGYNQSVSCNSGETGTGSVTVDVGQGEHVNCTFTNTALPANLTLSKETVPAGGEDFPFTLVSDGVVRVWGGTYGRQPGQFACPVDLATNAAGEVYVLDCDTYRIQKFDRFGNYLLGWVADGYPSGAAADAGGNLYVADGDNYQIVKYAGGGTVLDAWNLDGGPGDVAIDSAGNLYVTDSDYNRVLKFSSTGTLLDEWGDYGTGEGDFDAPTDIAIDSEDHVFVLDNYNYRVQKFANDGTFLAQWGSEGSDPGQFTGLSGIAVDGQGNVYVTDAELNRLQKFTNNGVFLSGFGETGTEPGQYDGMYGVAIDAAGYMYVADINNYRVQKYVVAVQATLDDGGEVMIPLDAAGYDIEELVPDGWDVTGITCNGGDPDVNGNGVSVALPAGGNVECIFTNTSESGSITIVKEVVGPVPANEWAFTGDLGAFTLPAAGGTSDPFSKTAGDYTITETAVPGYSQSVLCDSGETGTGSVTVSLQGGEAVTCTFTNTAQLGNITIVKEVVGQTPPNDWSFTGDLGAFTIDKAGGNKPFPDVNAGSYTVSETPVAGYAQSVSCDSGEMGTGSITVDLAAGENVTCTFTNTAQPGTITVVKSVVGQVPPADWAFTGDLNAFTLPAIGGNKTVGDLAADDYTINETAVSGYAQAVSCTSGETGVGSVTVSLQPGENVTCTFTNTAQAGSITVVKSVVGQVPPADWAFTGDLGAFTLPAAGGTSEPFSKAAGDYTINETAVPGYSQSILCDSGETGTGSVTVSLAPGENTTCTFTNTAEPGTIFFTKEVIGPNRAEPWTFSGNLGDFATYAGNVEYFPNLPPGNYTITETSVDGYTPAAACDSGETGTGSITVALDPGEIVHCTFTNTAQAGTITVVKSVVGQVPPADWAFTGDLDAFTLPAIGGSKSVGDLVADDYTINETAVAGYAQAVSCDSGESGTESVTVSLQPGENVTCTFTNTAQAGSITVVKEVSGQVPTTDWAFTGGLGEFTLPPDGGTSDSFSKVAGEYTITETAVSGYSQEAACDTGETGTASVTVILQPGEAVTCTFTNTAQPGRVTIVKEATPEDGSGFNFQTDLGPPSSFTLNDNGVDPNSYTFEGVAAGTYLVAEDEMWGWTLTGIVCDDADSAGEMATQTATIQVAPAEHVTCTFSNEQDTGTLVIVKSAAPADNTPFDFTHNLPGSGPTILSVDGFTLRDPSANTATFSDVPVGEYSVTESDTPGWQLDEISCTGTAWSTDLVSRRVTVDVTKDTTVTCTFTNTAQPGSITIVKEVVGALPAADWVYTGDLGDFTLPAAGGTSEPFSKAVGEYIITETAVNGYAQEVACDSGESGTGSVTVSLQPGEDVICTFTNTAQAGSITIVKEVGGQVPAADWQFTGDLGEFTLPAAGGTSDPFSKVAGEYTVTETAVPGYAQAVTCDSGEIGTGSVTVSLQPGENVTCTFTNTAQPGSITVVKEVVGQVPPADWAFTGDLGGFTLPAAGGTSEPFSKAAGDYTINETAVAGYAQAVSCDSGETGTGSVTVSLQPGENVTCTFTNTALRGSITVIKQVVGQVPAADWAFTGSFDVFTLPAAGGQKEFINLESRSYIIWETLVSGYSAAVACDSGETGPHHVTVSLQPGENVTCTFTNTAQPGSITVVKEVVGQVPPADWAYTGDLGEFTLPAAGGSSDPFSKAAGEYTITETAKPGYSQAVTCDSGETGTGSVTVSLQPGENVTCTFTNTAQAGSITIVKEVVGALPAADWVYTGDLGDFTLPAAGGTSEPFSKAAGEYEIIEAAVTGYSQAVTCDSGETGTGSVTVSLQPGENVTCTFTNTAQAGSITVVKSVVGAIPATDWQFTGDLGEFALPAAGGTSEPFSKAAGEYTITETAKPGYSQSVICDSGETGAGSVTVSLQPGEAVTCTFTNTAQPGTITVVKEVSGQVPTTDWAFTGDLDAFTLPAAGGTSDPFSKAAGDYTINETAKLGYSQSVTCDSGETGTGSVTVSLQPGEAVICTFTNTAQAGSITVVKQVNGAIPATDWQFTGDLGEFTLPAAGGTSDPFSKAAGEYTITEAAKPGYSQAVTCDSGETGTGSVTVSLQPGEVVTCTFTNTAQAGSITVVKQVNGAIPATDWQFTGDLGEFTLPAAGGTSDPFSKAAGEYTINETAKPGYSQSVICDSGETGTGSVTVSLQPGENVICTFTNTAQAGSITVVKSVVGAIPAAEWQFSGDLGAFTLPAAGGTSDPFSKAAGEYEITETAVAGYSQSVTCDSGETGTGSVTVSLQPGENVTCTFTNTAQVGSITVVKQVNGAIPANDWQFTGDLGEFTLPAAGDTSDPFSKAAGEYTITEAAVTGYSQAVTCDSGETGTGSVTVSLQPGENVVCTFTNTAQAGSITVKKVVSGQVPATDWQFTGDLGEFTLPAAGGTSDPFSKDAGDYTINETAKLGYSQSVTCDSGETGTGSVTVSLQPGEAVICTFTTLAEPATITVVKEVSGLAGDYAWSFAFTGELGNFTLDRTDPDRLFGALEAGAYNISETAVAHFAASASCDNGDSSATGDLTVTVDPGQSVTCTFRNVATPARLTIVKSVTGAPAGENWSFAYSGDLGAFTLTKANPSRVFNDLAADAYFVSETPVSGYDPSVACSNGDSSAGGDITVSLDPGDDVTCTFTNGGSDIFVTAAAGVADNDTEPDVTYAKGDILRWDGTQWTKWFNSAGEGLNPKADLTAFEVADESSGAAWLVWRQMLVLPGAGKTVSQDITYFDGATFTTFFDGSDVGLTLAGERIDGLEVLPGDGACTYRLLISTVTGGTVRNGNNPVIKFTGEDVLGFCLTASGSMTRGSWTLEEELQSEGLVRNNSLDIAVDGAGGSADRLYFLPKKAFTLDGVTVRPSEIALFDRTARTFSGPLWRAKDHGLMQLVDGIDVIGALP